MFGDSLAHARIDALTRQVTALEALVERLVDDAGFSQDEVAELREASNPGLTPEVRRLVAEDRTIEAIKQYRKATGAGLIDAKRAVEEYAARGHSS